jgi:hypothetical protein
VLRWTIDLARDLERLHREGRWHGAVGPDVVRIRGDRARLEPPGRTPAPVEYRDPEAERLRHKAGLPDPACEARQDVYGLGALLYSTLENGAPPCGSMSALTRPAPEALAWIVGRALAEGNGRYPTAAAMREDLERLLRELRGDAEMKTSPEVLPSFTGGALPAPRRLTPYRVAAKRERRGTVVLVALALIAFGIFAVAWRASDHDRPSPAAEASASPGATPTLPALLETWRERLSERLAAAGEHLDPLEVPLLVISDVPVPRDLGWSRHPSPRLAQDVRAAYDRGATPTEIRDLLEERAGDTTVPAALRVREGAGPDRCEVVLDYRGLRFTGVALRSGATPRR